MPRLDAVLYPAACFLVVSSITSAGPSIRIRDQIIVRLPEGKLIPTELQMPSNGQEAAIELSFIYDPLAKHGQSLPGNGILNPLASFNPATISETGAISFNATIEGAERNQGVFVVDEAGLKAIAVGCGGGGGSGDPGNGCGDPTPIGGTFSGFFLGTNFTPAINNNGDVLFLADVVGGASFRGLFLYRAAEGDIIKIVAVGDPWPDDGTISAVGLGSMNNHRHILFHAQKTLSEDFHILEWDEGLLREYVASGDPAPGGGTFAIVPLGVIGFIDGTSIPIGMVPDINESDHVSFFSLLTGGLAERGLFLSNNHAHEWLIMAGEPSPLGGTYSNFGAPVLNERNEIASFAEADLGGGDFTGGWVVGAAGNWRKALAFGDRIDRGEVISLAYSHNPMQPLDNCGNLIVWCVLQRRFTEQETTVVISPDGTIDILAQQDQSTPLGPIAYMDAWPSINTSGVASFSTAVTSNTGEDNAHFAVSLENELGDSDLDSDRDLDDQAMLNACLVGPALCPSQFGCKVFDADADGDTDLRDVASLQLAFGQ